MTSDRGTPRTELSDLEGVDLAYNLLMAAIGSEGNIETLRGKAKTIFEAYGIKLNEKDLEEIEPQLQQMQELASKRGLWGKIEYAVHTATQIGGAIRQHIGKRQKEGKTMMPSDIAANLYLTMVHAPAELVVNLAKSLLTIFDTMVKKLNGSVGINFKIFGKVVKTRRIHLHASLSERDVVLGSMVRRLNTPPAATVPLSTEDKAAARKIVFKGGAMTHAAIVSKSRERREERGRGIAS